MSDSVREEEPVKEDMQLEKIQTDIEEFLPQDSEDEEEGQEDSRSDRKMPNLYRGRALNSTELYKMTARQEVMLVLVAGMFHSGKTTLEMAIYQMFLRGANKHLLFAGSQTLLDVAERSKGLRVVSENPQPETERTSAAVADNYLHLSVMDEKKRLYHLVFTDFAGEIFDSANADKYSALLDNFMEHKHVIVLVDGEKLSGIEKNMALMECKSVISHLLERKIITEYTDVHLVYTKDDKILASDNPAMDKIIEENNRRIQKMLRNRTGRFCVHRTAAISRHKDKTDNYSGLESLLESLLDDTADEEEQDFQLENYVDRKMAKSSFERFAWKG